MPRRVRTCENRTFSPRERTRAPGSSVQHPDHGPLVYGGIARVCELPHRHTRAAGTLPIVSVLVPDERKIAMSLNRSIAAVALVSCLFGMGIGAGRALSQGTGPISAAKAKAEGAESITRGACVARCTARGIVTPAQCSNDWCQRGQCYRTNFEVMCVK